MSRLKICRPEDSAFPEPSRRRGRFRNYLLCLGVLALTFSVEGCASGPASISPPRPIVIHSGARIRPDQERMQEVNEWVLEEQRNIQEDPSFWVVSEAALQEVMPWEGMRLGEDSVFVQVPLGAQDATLVYQIYGHLHLMVEMDRQEEWLPEAPEATGYELERAIVDRIADAWILGRSVFDTQPFTPLDELAYAKDAGYLDAYIFTARPDEFAEARSEWARENPERVEEYRDWFLETFNREPPGLRTG